MGTLLIISLEPFIGIGLQFFQGTIELTSKSIGIKLILDGLVEAFAHAVRLRRFSFGARMFNVLQV